MFEWMAWTTPVAVFFGCIVLMIAGMTVWEIKSPTVMRKGFLPMQTTRGDRLFIGLLSAAYVNLAFVGISGWLGQALGLDGDPSIWFSFVASMMLLVGSYAKADTRFLEKGGLFSPGAECAFQTGVSKMRR